MTLVKEDDKDCLGDVREQGQAMLRIGPQAIFQIDELLGDNGEFRNLVRKIKEEVEAALGANEPQHSRRTAEVVPAIYHSIPPPFWALAYIRQHTNNAPQPRPPCHIGFHSVFGHGLHSAKSAI